MMKSMTKRVALGVPTVALSAALACTLAGCGGGVNDEAKNEANDTAPAVQEAGNASKAEPEAIPERKHQSIASRSAQRLPMGGSS